MEESAGQFGSHLAVLAPDQAATSVNRSDPGHRQFRSTQFASVVGQAAIQAQFTELHYGSLADTTGAAKQAKRKDQQTANDRFGTPTSSGDCEPIPDLRIGMAYLETIKKESKNALSYYRMFLTFGIKCL